MPSNALRGWLTAEARDLDQLEAAHAAVGGTGAGRRTATQQINDAYIVLTAALFQRYCRDVHTEAAAYLGSKVADPTLGRLLTTTLTRDRQLDRGNAHPSSLGNDFGRFEMELWDALGRRSSRARDWNRRLQQLNVWRNAIAHQDFNLRTADQPIVAGTRRTLYWARVWRVSCRSLAKAIDAALSQHLGSLVGARPW